MGRVLTLGTSAQHPASGVGCTAGDINRIITKTGEKPSKYDVDVAISKPYYDKNDYLVDPPGKDEATEKL